MTRTVFRSIFLTAWLTLAAAVGLLLVILYQQFHYAEYEGLMDRMGFMETGIVLQGKAYLNALSPGRDRVTWISAEGQVLYDSAGDAAAMDNHLSRSEVQSALVHGTGSSVRGSATLGEVILYQAKRLADGTVLRLAVPQKTIWAQVTLLLPWLLGMMAVSMVLAWVFARWIAGRIVKPLQGLDLDHPMRNDTYEELTPVLQRLEHQHWEVKRHRDALKAQQAQFSAITAHMSEGLVLLDDAWRVLSMNPAAKACFQAGEGCEGRDFLEIERLEIIHRTVERAMTTGREEATFTREGKTYLLQTDAVMAQGRAAGLVLLVTDISHRTDAERQRREFTANVSHELKTPLQSILGLAELIEHGMVRPEDIPGFGGRIHSESLRLLSLIQDIMRLSRLDEGLDVAIEPLSVRSMAEEVVSSLQHLAAEKAVRLSVHGEDVIIETMEPILREVLFNLMENAIRYNRPQGTAEIKVAQQGEQAVIRVQDTGIGIAAAHQPLVFQRFYRVDKSHASTTGGTGLGLSIVKHGVQTLGGTVALSSTPGEGSVFQVTLPLQLTQTRQ